MNLIERFFSDLTCGVVPEESFRIVHELVKDIERYLVERNEHYNPYQWKTKGEDILVKIRRAKIAMARAS